MSLFYHSNWKSKVRSDGNGAVVLSLLGVIVPRRGCAIDMTGVDAVHESCPQKIYIMKKCNL